MRIMSHCQVFRVTIMVALGKNETPLSLKIESEAEIGNMLRETGIPNQFVLPYHNYKEISKPNEGGLPSADYRDGIINIVGKTKET